MSDISVIILAAGKGSRMKSSLPKVMHKVAGRQMLHLVIDEAKKLNPKNITIVVSDEMKDFEKEIISSHEKTDITFALQKTREGTAHAVSTALKSIKKIEKKVLILYGDTPLISSSTLEKMLEKLDESAICILGFDCHGDNHYGRLVVDINGHLEKIIEFKDANKNERKISLCNSGVMAVDGAQISSFISAVKNDNAANEFYLTDIVKIAADRGLKRSVMHTKMDEVLGVNSREELSHIEKIKQNQLRLNAMAKGATLIDPSSVYFSFDTEISSDVIIHPNVVFGENVKIESRAEIKSFCHIEGAHINHGAVIGPFARIRPGTNISRDVHIGNFVEIKKSEIKAGAKINHLSYIGDAEIGEESNIGAGTITCNYDGYKKSKTKIGKKVFVGSNSSLVAPLEIADGALIAAGSVITKDVEKDSLAISRTNQTNVKDGAQTFRASRLKEKK